MSTPHGEHELSRALELAKDFVQGKPLAKEDLDLATRILDAIARIETIETMETPHPLAAIAEAAGKLAARAAQDPANPGAAQQVPPRTSGGLRRLNRSREGEAPAGDEPDSA